MSESRPDGTNRVRRKAGTDRVPDKDYEDQETILRIGHPSNREDAEADRASGGDEILRTERGGAKGVPAAGDPTSVRGRDVPVRADREHRSDPGRGPAPYGPAGGTNGGWLPTGVLLTLGEALAAVLVAEIGWGLALLALTLAERLAELPQLFAEHGLAATFLFGLVCGTYVLVRLRSRRLAWRRHLRGEP